MAVINWYPGHMTKSIRMIEENVKLIDVLVYVLDARAPKSCINPDFIKYGKIRFALAGGLCSEQMRPCRRRTNRAVGKKTKG